MTPQALLDAVDEVLKAEGYWDVFQAPPPGTEPADYIKRRYRQLLHQVHPDRFSQEAEKQRATEAFNTLQQLHERARYALKTDRYGQPVFLATIRSRRAEHQVLRTAPSGDLTNCYVADTVRAGTTSPTFLKVAVSPRDNDLLVNEAKALKALHGPDAEAKWFPYVSELVDSFIYTEPGKPRRQANALTLLPGFYSLQQLRQVFPAGIPAVHAVWMWRRLLVALGFAHDNGVVHGAVLPQNVMIWPEEHGLVLVDWCYSSIQSDDTYPVIKAIVNRQKDWYPPEVLAKQAPSPATDIYLAAKTMIDVMGGNAISGWLPNTVPLPLRAFFRGCLQLTQTARPQNAWLLLQEFDELLEHMGKPFYPRHFRTFVVPAGIAT